jgi:hypothetical protein
MPCSVVRRCTAWVMGRVRPPRLSVNKIRRRAARYDEAKTLQAELDHIQADQPAQDDPALLDELPDAAAFNDAPEDIKAKFYAAFDIQVLYRAPIKQATIWATITPTTPAIIAALTTNPRTDHDTAYGHRQMPLYDRKNT